MKADWWWEHVAQEFVLEVQAFHTLVGDDCPLPFLLLAIHCCSVSTLLSSL